MTLTMTSSRRSKRSVIYLMTLLGMLCIIDAAPPIQKRDKAGPCIGMDCLHGILMHGDATQGDGHKHEDTYDRLQEQDSLKGQKIGPGDDSLTNIGVETMQQGEKEAHPENQKAAGPNDAMTELHGVLMHGDDHHGTDHHKEDSKVFKTEENVKKGPDHEALHGILMHGDAEQGHNHAEEDKELQEKKHEGKVSESGDPEAKMHGGEGHDVHNESNVHVDPKDLGVPSVGDLEAAIHGKVNEKMEIKPVTEDTATPEEDKEYKKWINKKADNLKGKKEGKDKDGGGGWGFTFPFISDSILNELDLMKRRYLKKFWGKGKDDVAYKEKDLRLEKKKAHDIQDDIAAVGDTGPVHHVHEHKEEKAEDVLGHEPRRDL